MSSVFPIQLIRPKSRFKTARGAWKDIDDRTGVRPNQVNPRHTSKSWVWVPKPSSGITLKKPSRKSKKLKIKRSSKPKSRKTSSTLEIKKLLSDTRNRTVDKIIG